MRQAEARVIRQDSHPIVFDQKGQVKMPFSRGKIHVHTIVTTRGDDRMPICQTADERIEELAFEKEGDIDVQVEKLSQSAPRPTATKVSHLATEAPRRGATRRSC